MLVSSRGWFELLVKNNVERKALELTTKRFDIERDRDGFDTI
jgi:hypothetical protein